MSTTNGSCQGESPDPSSEVVVGANWDIRPDGTATRTMRLPPAGALSSATVTAWAGVPSWELLRGPIVAIADPSCPTSIICARTGPAQPWPLPAGRTLTPRARVIGPTGIDNVSEV